MLLFLVVIRCRLVPLQPTNLSFTCRMRNHAQQRFYKRVSTREAEDGNRWNVMLDYTTLKTPGKRLFKLPNLFMAKVVAAEWEYQLIDGIRPRAIPLMRIACTALERVPLMRQKIIDPLMMKFSKDLAFCRAPEVNVLTLDVHGWGAMVLTWMQRNCNLHPSC